MDNFVLYDEISSSDGVTVYKGRRKGTINFLAIYCIDKRLRAEITNQVRLTHELQHDNVVRFAEWYETSNHLWLVVELCTGGSLGTLLRQDGRLPESCVRQFATDLVAGLHFVHSVGIVLGNLHADGVQLDASGTLKLGDFRTARLTNENLAELYEQFAPTGRAGTGASTSESSNTLVLEEEGEEAEQEGKLQPDGSETEARYERLRPRPSYTPPEFVGRANADWFGNDCCSMATDFWQLGCLLFEMFIGVPPFGDEREPLDELRSRILYQQVDFAQRETHVQPTVNQLPNGSIYSAATSARQLRERPTADFAALIALLLDKDPRKRATWPSIITHRFWRGELERRVRAANASFNMLDSATIVANESDADVEELEPDTHDPTRVSLFFASHFQLTFVAFPLIFRVLRKLILPVPVLQSVQQGGDTKKEISKDTKKIETVLAARPATAVRAESKKSGSGSESLSSNDLESTVRQADTTQSGRQPKSSRANVAVERSEHEPQPRASLASSSAYRSLLLTAQTVFAQGNTNVASNDETNSSASSANLKSEDDAFVNANSNAPNANTDAVVSRPASASANQKAPVLRNEVT